MIDDDIIKEKILKYRSDSSDTTIDDIKAYIFDYVHSYPQRIYRANEQRATNFYIYYMERFTKMLSSYQITEVKFLTWLTCTLRTSYLNYIKQTNGYKKFHIEEVSLDNDFFDEKGSSKKNLHDIMLVVDNTEKDEDLVYAEKLNKYIVEKYDTFQSIVFRLHYLEIFNSFIPYDIFEYFDFTYEEVYGFLDEARATYLDKYQAYTKTYDKIVSLTRRILELDREQNQRDEIIKLKAKKQRQLLRLKQFKIVVPYAHLSGIFNISTNKISKMITKIRENIKSDFNGLEL